MPIKIPVGVAGLFHNVEVLRADGSVKYETGEFSNLILDQGLVRMAQNGLNAITPAACFTSCSVGTGNSTPLASQTQLDNQIASVSISDTVSSAGHDHTNGYVWARYEYTFPIGAINNQNVSELAIGWGGGEAILSRALIRDVNGDPTSITILTDEQLRVTWEHRRYWPQTDIEGVIANEGNKGGSYEYSVRPANISSWSIGSAGRSGLIIVTDNNSSYNAGSVGIFPGGSILGGIDSRPSGGGTNYAQMQTRINPDGKRACGRVTLGLAQGNLAGGIGAIVYGNPRQGWNQTLPAMSFQMSFDPPLPKTSEDLLEIDLFIEPFRVS